MESNLRDLAACITFFVASVCLLSLLAVLSLYLYVHDPAAQNMCSCLFCWIFFVSLNFMVNFSAADVDKKPVLFFIYLCLCCLFFFCFLSRLFPLFFACLFVSPLFLSLSLPLSQRERQDCAAVWLAAVSGACLSWPTYQWRPRICGRFPVNPSSWLRSWAMASLEKSGWVGMVGLCRSGGRWQL